MKPDDLEGLITPEIGRRLQALAAMVTPRAVVEIGSFKGKSTAFLAAGSPNVYAVDPWDLPGNIGGRRGHRYADATVRETFERQLTQAGLRERVTAIQGFSTDVAKGWTLPIGLLYIDGSHLYGDVRGDFEAWSPFIVVGGAVAFDDYRTRRNPGVTRFVDELRKERHWGRWELQPLAVARRLSRSRSTTGAT